MFKHQQSINILWVMVTHILKGTSTKAHTHEYYHLTHVHNGTLVYNIGGKIYHVKPGETILIPPGVSHSQDDILDDLAIASEIKFVLGDTTLHKMLRAVPMVVPATDEATGLLDRIVSESILFNAVSQACMHSYLNALLYIWARDYHKENGDEDTVGVFDTSGFSPLTKSILKYLEDNYSGNVNLQALADELGYNKFYICNAFKQDTGSTIFECLAILRVRHAAELISYSELSLENVGSRVGFSSISHFNRVFKAITGIPPGQYRRHYPAEILTVERTEMDLNRDDYVGLVKPSYEEPFILSVLARQKISGEMLNMLAKKSSSEDL